MNDGDKSKAETNAGFRHRRSSRPPAELPEPIVDVSSLPIKTLHQYIAELHHDMRSLRSEFMHRQEAAREAIYGLQMHVTKLTSAMEEMRRSQERAYKVDRLAIAFITLAIFVFLVLRSYRFVGV